MDTRKNNILKRTYYRMHEEVNYRLWRNKWKSQGLSKESYSIIYNSDYRARKFLEKARGKGFRIVTRGSMLKYKNSDRLYILGSGPSINDIDQLQWEAIKKYDSLALNWFIAHHFVPTYYHMELLVENANLFKECYLAKSDIFKKKPMIFNCPKLPDNTSPIDYSYIEDLYLSIAKAFGGGDINHLREALEYVYFKRDYKKENLLVRTSGSLMIAISFGVLMGYDEIVLVGVDLDTREYFFYDQDLYNDSIALKVRAYKIKEQKKNYKKKPYGSLHKVADPKLHRHGLSLDKVVLLMNDFVLKPKGIRLYLYSEKSLLYPQLEVLKSD